MSTIDSVYPPGIVGVPPGLTQPSARYKWSVKVLLAGLILFMVFYLALLTGSALFAYQMINYHQAPGASDDSTWHYIGAAMGLLLCLFLIKGIFKRSEMDDDQMEIKESDQPELFAFIRRLCADTQAPFPHRIFISPDVNAAVAYNSTLLNLIVPTKKNLVIGMGLVNILNLTEFKAVLAHEFGHFSQSSMRLGSYVYLADRIIADMVYKRDSFDSFLRLWRRQDIRIAIFGHIFALVLWLLRKILMIAHGLINLLGSAMSRQMEFHADLVAVSVTGSDSLIHALRRLNFGHDSMLTALEELKVAAQHHLYTGDLYFHQLAAGQYLRQSTDSPRLGLSPELPVEPKERIQVFQPGEEETPSMWSSHPSNCDREENAKRIYLRSSIDDRSPWILFRNPEALRLTVTSRFYEIGLGLPRGTAYTDPQEVQAFIEKERAETRQDACYLGMYDGRWIRPSDVDELARAAHSNEVLAAVDTVFRKLYHREYRDRLSEHRQHVAEVMLLQGLHDRTIKLKQKTFPFRGSDYRFSDVSELLTTVVADLKRDSEWLCSFDSEVFSAHYACALASRDSSAQALLERYHFEKSIQDILQNMNEQRLTLDQLLRSVGEKDQLGADEMKKLLAALGKCRGSLVDVLVQAQSVVIPPLENMPPDQALAPFLLEEAVVPYLSESSESLSGAWLNSLSRQIGQVQERSGRLDSKNVGAMLALQERIAGPWLTANPPPDENAVEQATPVGV